tara:strand:- start:821 stop:1747 length:927 start_codon:yes stop_codon:yes gene_type:complete
MRNLVTISDSAYLQKGLTLYESLVATQKQKSFVLNYICLDDNTYEKVASINQDSIKAIHISELENDNFELRNVRNLSPSREALSNGQAQNRDPKHIQFCWALASYSCYYFIHRLGLDNVYYLDADLFFYDDLEMFDEEVNERSVGIVRHRIDYLETSGEFNVGIVYFKNDYIGKKCSEWWKRQLSSEPSSNPFYAYYGQCGDQKYLELFPLIFGDAVAIVDKEVGHLAPWNATFHEYENDHLIWNGQKQKLLYFHFAHFKLTDESYKTSYNNEWIWGAPEDFHPFVKTKYDDYFVKTKDVIRQYRLQD